MNEPLSAPENLRKEVVIITGSSGLIGSAIVRRLAGRVPVVGFDRAGDSGRKPESVECVCVDVTSDESVHAGFSRVRYAYGNRIASVIHLAAYYDFSGSPSPKYEEITVRGTERLLGALHAFETEQFIFSSTILVHAPSPPGERLTEDSPLEPKWPYPESKVTTEQLIRAERDGIPAVLLRIAGVYDDRCHSIPLAHQIQRIYERQLTSHFFPGDVTRGRQSFVHLDDLVEALALTVEHRAGLPPELALLIGEPDALSYEELQDEFGCLIHGKEWETIRIPELMAEAGAWVQEKMPVGPEPFIRPWMVPLADDEYVPDITRAKNAIAWEPMHNLRGSIPDMVGALKADPLEWYRENKLDAPSWLEETATGAGAAHLSKPQEHGHHTMTMSGGGDAMDMPGMGTMTSGTMMAEPQAMSLWVNAILMLLGAWLISSPATLGYGSAAMAWSDIASGALIIIFAALALSRRGWAAWATSFVGAWLLIAPLIFWAPTAAGYLNNTLIGALVIVFSILIPMGMPMSGPDVPRGWSYNPSTWLQRTPVIALGFIGLIGARYMAAYQLGHIDNVWEPFFGDGTVRVLESDVSRAWPVSDAGLGATTYMLEILMGLMGDKRRWRTMPWMVAFFGILVVPLGVTSIVLIILQPLSVGAWCTICLATAVAMLIMIPLTLDEVVAMGQFLAQSRRAGKPFWRTFWLGGDLEDGTEDTHAGEFGSPLPETPRAMTRGMTLPVALLGSAALGVWLMFAPSVLGIDGTAAGSNHLVGALVVTFAVIALAEVARSVRFVNVALGAWVALSPWLLTGASGAAAWGNVVAGALLILLSIPRGRIVQRYGSWERYTR
ncbi:MAG: NAD-dependent epimerase/dehydratase family protein [Gemmatimonadaceae bacterium]|nr:NAD-dependent epimerase/dehydratase family protein [Gemmatimonadaceae bacterium]